MHRSIEIEIESRLNQTLKEQIDQAERELVVLQEVCKAYRLNYFELDMNQFKTLKKWKLPLNKS